MEPTLTDFGTRVEATFARRNVLLRERKREQNCPWVDRKLSHQCCSRPLNHLTNSPGIGRTRGCSPFLKRGGKFEEEIYYK